MDGTEAPAEAPEILETPDGRRIAYHRRAGAGTGAPGVVFLGGFKSDMTGSKATFLEARAARLGRPSLRLDYTGHGASSGRFEDGCIGDWARDAEDAILALTEGPQVIVGSSMGGWIAFLLARRAAAAPDGPLAARIAALVTVAAAPDFTEDSMAAAFTAEQRATLARDGRLELPSEYSDAPYVITRRLIEDGRERLILRSPLRLPIPVRMLQGTADVDVPVDRAMALLGHVESPDLRLQLVAGADHRFSEPRELAILDAAVEEVAALVPPAPVPAPVPGSAVAVRAAEPGDAPVLIDMLKGLQAAEMPMDDNRRPPEAIDAHCQRRLDQAFAPGGLALVAEIDGRPAGMLMAVENEWPDFVLPELQRSGDVLELFVEAGARGRGIAGAMLEAAESAFAARGIRHMSIMALAANDPACRAYAKWAGRPANAAEFTKRIGGA